MVTNPAAGFVTFFSPSSMRVSSGTSRYEYMAGLPHLTQTACSLVTDSAMAIMVGMGPNGSPLKSISSPATMTRIPLLASTLQTEGNSSSKNCASSRPITSTSLPNNNMADALSTGVDGIELEL